MAAHLNHVRRLLFESRRRTMLVTDQVGFGVRIGGLGYRKLLDAPLLAIQFAPFPLIALSDSIG